MLAPHFNVSRLEDSHLAMLGRMLLQSLRSPATRPRGSACIPRIRATRSADSEASSWPRWPITARPDSSKKSPPATTPRAAKRSPGTSAKPGPGPPTAASLASPRAS